MKTTSTKTSLGSKNSNQITKLQERFNAQHLNTYLAEHPRAKESSAAKKLEKHLITLKLEPVPQLSILMAYDLEVVRKMA